MTIAVLARADPEYGAEPSREVGGIGPADGSSDRRNGIVRSCQHDCRAFRTKSRQIVHRRQSERTSRRCARGGSGRRTSRPTQFREGPWEGDVAFHQRAALRRPTAGRASCLVRPRAGHWDAVATTSSASRRCASWPVRVRASGVHRVSVRAPRGRWRVPGLIELEPSREAAVSPLLRQAVGVEQHAEVTVAEGPHQLGLIAGPPGTGSCRRPDPRSRGTRG